MEVSGVETNGGEIGEGNLGCTLPHNSGGGQVGYLMSYTEVNWNQRGDYIPWKGG